MADPYFVLLFLSVDEIGHQNISFLFFRHLKRLVKLLFLRTHEYLIELALRILRCELSAAQCVLR